MKTVKKFVSALLAVALTLTVAPGAHAFRYSEMTSELSVEGYEITTVAPETQYISLRASNASGKQNINAVEFNPKNEYTVLRAGKSAGYVYSTQTVNTIANNMSDTNGDVAVAAINGDYFTFGVGVPHGVFIDEGIILSTPPQYYAAFGLTYDNEPFIVRHGTILDKIFRINGVLVDVAGINTTHAKGSDSLILYTSEYARGTKTGTETYELRCRLNSGEVRHGGTISFTVEEVFDAVGNTSLGDGYIVLSATGARIDDLKKLSIGETHEMSFRFNEFWSNVKFAVGGLELLLKDGEVYSTADKANQPRTSIGIRADGTVVMATFDGRSAGGAVGMTYQTAAEGMRALGCVDALNLDGGGSTTFVLRTPGAMKTEVVNNVSGSSARQVANAVVLMNTAPTKRATGLSVSPAFRNVIVGGTYKFAVSAAYDENYKPCPVPSRIEWETDSPINTISDDGTLTATEAGTVTLSAYGDAAYGTAKVEVVDTVSEIVTDKTSITAKAGETVEISAKAYLSGKPVECAQELFTWSAPEHLGTFDEPGKFTLSETATAGKITVSLGDVHAYVEILPQTPPVEICGFEGDEFTLIPVGISTKVNPNFKFETDSKFVHYGERSLKVYYNFLNTTGSVGSYYQISPDSADTSAFTLSAIPKKLGMLVLGDGSGVELRSLFEDANGTQHSVSYGRIEHTGWKYMEATLPENISGPIYVKVPVHLVSNPEKLTQGCLYFDTLRAVYSDIEEDMTAPEITKAWPSDNMLIYAKNPSIGVILRDDKATETDAGISPETVEIHVNGYNCTDRGYDAATGKISYTVKNALKAGYHTILVRARDYSGNLIVKEWKFEVR
ncbi:MAG: phosphodiester glycosidase family protein [Oscillospiraceae bacterium]|nr:phosphodiester glycosidase family protein [Oscillospiraceae bacterium]